MAQSKTSRAVIKSVEREIECLELRSKRNSYRTIAKMMDMSVAGVYDAVSRAIGKLAEQSSEKAGEVRFIELENLDMMEAALLLKVGDGDFAAVDRVLRIQERRSKLLGLDAPARQVVATMTHEQMLAELDDPGDDA